jgi:hypothetical protein
MRIMHFIFPAILLGIALPTTALRWKRSLAKGRFRLKADYWAAMT